MPLELNVDQTILANKIPLTSDTDFKTIVDTLVYNSAGLELFWVFTTIGGVYSRTPLTPLSNVVGADYRFVNVGDGYYTVLIPAELLTTQGKGFVQGFSTGVLTFVGPEYDFEKIRDASFDKTSAAFKGLVMFGGGKSTFNTADNKSTFYDAAGSTIVFTDVRSVAAGVVTRTVT